MAMALAATAIAAADPVCPKHTFGHSAYTICKHSNSVHFAFITVRAKLDMETLHQRDIEENMHAEQILKMQGKRHMHLHIEIKDEKNMDTRFTHGSNTRTQNQF